ncbi:hypothetical protein [Pseudomonas kilonensis]|uniref:hypothetical protein n=1 Tax=Pseudomonas kilonensis TaxID=132476 RepID=UPI000466FB2D|nr:hypothetical protein [Pseudomonas kilonensis]
MQFPSMQEFTLVTKSGAYHQAGVTLQQPGVWTPHLAEKPKASQDYASCMYTTLAGRGDGDAYEQFKELVERADGLVTQNGEDPVVGWFIHTGPTLLSIEQIQKAIGQTVEVTQLND